MNFFTHTVPHSLKNASFNEAPEVNTVAVTFKHLQNFYSKKELILVWQSHHALVFPEMVRAV